MSDDAFADRRALIFEQAEGFEPLPAQLQPKELSEELRALLWRVVHENMASDMRRGEFGGHWTSIFYDKHTLRDHLMADEFENDADALMAPVKQLFVSGNYVHIFGFLQFVLRHRSCPYRFPETIAHTLRYGRAAYRVLDGRTIIPIGSDAEQATLERAFADLAAKEFRGARSHLNTAGSELTSGNYAASVRESIHAVESVARTLAPSGSLSDALAQVEKSASMHSALKRGFTAIYGYTSDEKGIRHPLLDDAQANVDEADALFMIGGCAAFVSYMVHKARLAGLLSPSEPRRASRGKRAASD
jgi:hypothetical protein